METDALQVLVIILSTTLIVFLIAVIVAAVVMVRLVKKVSSELDKAGSIADNVMSFTSGMSRLGMPIMVSRILFGIARKAFSKH